MICLQFGRMLTLRNIVALLFLEASFSLAIANNQDRRARKLKTTLDPGGCNIIQVDNANTLEVSLTPRGKPKLVKIPNRKLQLSQGGSIQYSCLRKHHIYGEETLMCKANGEWSQPPPVCVAPLCSPIQTPDDDGPLKMESVVPHNGAVLRFSCSSGFILRGSSTIYCSRKRWNDHPPECIGTPSTTTYRHPTQDSTTPVESVKTTTSGSPAVDESPTTSPDDTDEGFPSVATVEKVKTSEAFRVITITVATRTSPLPMSTRVASSTVESQAPEFTTPEAELLQSVDVGDHRSHPTLKTEESTAPSSAPAFSSFPDDVMESDTTAFNNLDRITRSSSGELTEAQGTSSFEMFNQDEETEEPDRRATETHQLFPDEELEEKVSTSDDAYETTSQKPFETEESVATSAEMMVSESEEQDDTTPETRDLSSASGIGLKKIEDDDAELQSPTLESVSHYTVSQELLTVQSSSSRIQVPINEAETRRPPEESLSSITVESEDVNLPLGHDFTETDSKSQRSLIVTHFPTKTPTEGSSDKTLVMRPEEIPTNENKTGKTRSRSQSVLTTHVPPLNPSGYRSTPVSVPTIDSAAMTRGNSASIVLIVIIVAAVIVLVVLLSILGKALLPKCTLLQKPCNEQGAVPYTAQSNQPDQVVLKGINPMPENDSCTQV